MQAQALKAAASGGKSFERVGFALDDMRNSYLDAIKASSAYDVRQTKSISQVEQYTKRLQEQKVHAVEAWKNRKMMNQVIKEQIDLQRAQAVSWRKDSSGRVMSDLIIPRDAVKGIDTARIKLGAYNGVLQSVASETVKWGKNTQWAGRQLMVGFTVPLGIAAAAMGKMAYDMDKALTQITKVYGDATQEFQDSSEEIRATAMQTANNMARMYGQSAQDTLEIEAQFAAAGKTGAELQQATAAATKARMLNEIDLQKAIDASITMQTVYGYTAEELGQKWEYINAVANQTVLGAEDFATAIPKVAGINKELGGTIEDLGVLMVAFKSAGIEAAEGANALKTISFRAVSAYGKGLETFKAMTGKDLKAIVAETNGETIPTLMKMYEAMQNLSTPDKIAVVKDVFGIYQGNKALMLLEQLTGQSEQMAQALAVGKNSVADNAAIANQELERMNAQPYKRIEKAIEAIKIEMANLGKTVLPIGAAILEWVSGFINNINNMDAGTKKFLLIAGAAVAIVGPVTMLLGLFGNLFGNIMKLQGAFGSLLLQFKYTNAEERAQALIGKQAASVWDRQTSAVANLAEQLQRLNATMSETAALQKTGFVSPGSLMNKLSPGEKMPLMGPYLPQWSEIKTDKNGRALKPSNSASGWSRMTQAEETALWSAAHRRDMEEVNRSTAERAIKEQQIAKAQKEQLANQKNMVRNAGGTAASAGMLAMMFGPSGGLAGAVSDALFGIGTLMTIAPGVATTIIKSIGSPFVSAGNMAKTQIAKMKLNISGLGASLKSMASAMALPLAAAAAAAIIYWQKVSDAADEADAKAKAYVNSAKALGEMSGVNWTEATGVPTENMTGEQRFASRAEEFRKKFAEEAQAIVDSGAETGDKWGIAISKGVEVRLHGGTVEAAKEATRTALAIMGENFDDKEFEVQVNAKVNFENQDDLIKSQLETAQRELGRAVNDLGTGAERFNRDHGFAGGLFSGGQNDLTKAARTTAENVGKEFFNGLRSIDDPRKRREVYDKFVQDNVSDMKGMYDKIFAERKKLGSNPQATFQQFIENNGDFASQWMRDSGMNNDQIQENLRKLEAIKYAMQGIATQTGQLSNSQISEIFSPDQLTPYLETLFKIPEAERAASPGIDLLREIPQMREEYGAMMDRAAQGGRNLSEAERLVMLNIVRANHGMAAATSLAQGFNYAQAGAAQSSMTLAEALKSVGSSLDEAGAIDMYKGVIESTTSDMADFAMNSLNNEADAAANALDREMDAVMAGYDKRSDAADKKMQAREDKLKKSQENRRKRIEDYYDAQIDKIDKQIEKENALEDARQKAFEKEQQRQQRLAQMSNQNIDLNTAINTGKFDEAAKIANDMAAQAQQWANEDSNAAAQDKHANKIKGLEGRKDAFQKAKDSRLEALKQAEDAEDKALARDKERMKERLDASKAAAQAEFANRKRTNQLIWNDRKTKLQQELDTIRAFIPRNKAELNQQAADIDAAYRKYGVKLEGYGTTWAKYVGDQFLYHQQVSANKLKSDVAWTSIGKTITDGLLKGGFGMTAKAFASWLNGGKAPKGSIFEPTNTTGKRPGSLKPGSGSGQTAWSHTGSIAGYSDGKRTGWSGKGLTQSEMQVNVLKGQGILTRKATDWIGHENIRNLNRGKLPKNTGPWNMASSGGAGVAAAASSGATKEIMRRTIQAVAQNRGLGLAGVNYGGVDLGPVAAGNWFKPARGPVSSEYGMRVNPVTGIYKLHGGIDIAAGMGAPIYAAKSGLVTMSGYYPSLGNYVRINHGGGIQTGYAHQSKIEAAAGARVRAGQEIGRVGSTGNSTGPHLHFEYWKGGQRLNPRMIIPGFSEGGYTLSSGLAQLHPRETILSEPLSDNLKQGLNQFAQGGNAEYNVEVHFHGAGVPTSTEIKRGVKQAIVEIEREKGPKRRIGDKS